MPLVHWVRGSVVHCFTASVVLVILKQGKVMTKQDMFDKMVKGLKAQGWQKSQDAGGCLYFGDNDRCCAVGHLIPIDLKAKIQGREENTVTVGTLLAEEILPVVLNDAMHDHYDFVGDMQVFHDSGMYLDASSQLTASSVRNLQGISCEHNVKINIEL